MKTFLRALAERRTDPARRRWVYVPYDQLSEAIGPLAREAPADLGIVLVEAPRKAARRPYHRQKLAFVLANQRHFALEQAERGVAVRYVVADGAYADALAPLAAELGPLRVMEPAERELRADLAPLVADGRLAVLPHEGWLSTRADFLEAVGPNPPWRMDAFYRHARRRTGLLMDERGEPEGGRLSFDAENRRAWPGTPAAPTPPRYAPDAITEEVGALVEARFAAHPGTLDLGALPATAADAERAWDWALARVPARTSGRSRTRCPRARARLFHTRISAAVQPRTACCRAAWSRTSRATALPLASREGFIRQILGWREFVRHVHAEHRRPAPHPRAAGRTRRVPRERSAGEHDDATEHPPHPLTRWRR